MQKILNVMKLCPLFKGIAFEQLEALLGCLGAKRRSYGKGETIMAEGCIARYLGIVLSGGVQVIREDYYGNRSMMAKLGTADMFAEAFACAGVPAMPVSVIATEVTEVLLIDACRIMHSCGNACSFHNQLIYNMMRILATKNLMANQKIEVMSRRNTREKLMAYLLMQAKQAGGSSFTIPYDRQELADYLGVDRSGLSAEIGKLRREGVLRSERNSFMLLREPEEE